MNPYLDDGDVQLYHGDVCQVLAELPAGSVQTCITSPPYFGLRDYQTGSWTGGGDDCDHLRSNRYSASTTLNAKVTDPASENKRTPYGERCGKCGARRVDQQLGLEPTPTLYVERMVAVFREVWRVLRDDGTLWLNLGDSYASSGIAGEQSTTANLSRHGDQGHNPKMNGQMFGRAPTPPGLKAKDLVGIPWRLAFALQQPWYSGTIKREVDRVWLAAVIEAEGCLFIHKRGVGQYASSYERKDGTTVDYHRKNATYGSGLEVSSTDRVIVERCLEITGLGSICEQSPDQNTRRKQTLYRWNLRTNECRDVIRELYPHLIAKQHEARLLIACPPSGKDAERAHESLKALHQGGTPDIDFPPPASMFERGWCLRSDVIWAKCIPNPMPESVTDRPTKSHEYIFLLTKQARYMYDADAVREPHAPDGRHVTGRTSANGTHENHRLDEGERRERWPGAGRNLRSVWQIATQPFPDAHFATFPEALVERCILAGTSEHGECVECGKAWRRVVERSGQPPEPEHRNPAKRLEPGQAGNVGNGNMGFRASRLSGQEMAAWKAANPDVTTGWEPSCECDAAARPQTVLDPFVGSGTTALVARRLARRCIGVDLSREYLEIAARRTRQLSLLGDGQA